MLVKPTRLNAFVYVFDHFSCMEENERQILLALYIRLEYSKSCTRVCIFAYACFSITGQHINLRTGTPALAGHINGDTV